MFDPVFSDPPILLSPIHLLIAQSLGGEVHMLSLVCVVCLFFFRLGRVHVISTGPISTVLAEGRVMQLHRTIRGE
ncbi:unnamed protein product [Staurois parvus]|uniref:Uncharacterized protein n=1 Tax=Staurois parvus TaxID=386267 RepID=A0ABN9DL66_9NEOB|nr:unnamed protein product [Staurois parvus]